MRAGSAGAWARRLNGSRIESGELAKTEFEHKLPDGYYSYDLGTWHVVVLNSNCSAIGGCGSTSPQATWLRADLAANGAKDVLAYWHHPRFSSGTSHGSSTAGRPSRKRYR